GGSGVDGAEVVSTRGVAPLRPGSTSRRDVADARGRPGSTSRRDLADARGRPGSTSSKGSISGEGSTSGKLEELS
ncbi:hypothetical protein CYJ73_02630, partial [Gordonia terrae]